MIKKLPIWYKDINSVELKKPTGKVISDTYDDIKTKNKYIAMRNFVSGCTEKFGEIVDPIQIKRSYDLSSNKNLEYLSQELMIWYYNGEDYIEGVYACPRCNTKQIAELKNNDGIETDTRDRISSLKVGFMENPEESFQINFSSSIILESEKGSETIESIEMVYPTTEMHVQAIEAVGETKEFQTQYEIWARAIIKVNGSPIDKNWIRAKGRLLFNSINEKSDIDKISNAINKYGVSPYIEKTCKECGKEFRTLINTFNFFDFAPR